MVADKDDQVNMYDASSYFDYSVIPFWVSMGAMVQLVEGWETDEIEEANFYVSDAAQLDNVIAEVQKILLYQLEQFQYHC